MKKFFVWVVAALILLPAAPRLAYAANETFGFVNIAKVFDEYQRTKENDDVLQEAGKKKEREREALVQTITKLKDEMSLLAESAKEAKQEELDKKVRDLQDFDQNAKRELGEKRAKMVRDIFQDIDEALRSYGERKGYDMIFNERALLYRQDKYDVTQDILNILNKDYSKKKKK